MKEVMKKDLKQLYYEIKDYIDKVDFTKLWKGFKPFKFALYNENECFFDGEYIKKTDAFIANTAINFNGEVIAIWNVIEDVNPIVLASKMIHEMFHGYQMVNNESRFPDELDALYHYQYNDENLSIKLEENKLLISLLDKFEKNSFNKLLEYRKYRLDKYHYEYLYEARIEQIEGTANYIEINVLKQLSIDLYLEKLKELKNRLVNKGCFLPIRILCYDIGALLLMVLKDNNISFNGDFNEEAFAFSLVKDIEKKDIDYKLSFSEEINQYFNRAKAIINKAVSNNDIVVEGNYDILGVNVYNAIYYDHYIISIYFLMYGKKDESKIEYGNFVIESKEDKKLTKVYRY